MCRERVFGGAAVVTNKNEVEERLRLMRVKAQGLFKLGGGLTHAVEAKENRAVIVARPRRLRGEAGGGGEVAFGGGEVARAGGEHAKIGMSFSAARVGGQRAFKQIARG